MKADITVLPGDGIGPEVTAEAVKVLQAVAERFGHEFHFHYELIGAEAIRRTGSPLPPSTLVSCRKSKAVLLGSVGHPDFGPNSPVKPEQGLLWLRQELGLYMNLRPVKTYPFLAGISPLKKHILENTDILIVRELTGGIYFGKKEKTEYTASDACTYSAQEIDRVAFRAFELARERRKKLTLIDKANVLATSVLWRERVSLIHQQFRDVYLEHMYVDNAAMQLIMNPSRFDVILTENMFGDILSDEASVLSGSLGLLPSASLGTGTAVYEPIHGSWPEAAQKGIADPIGAILSAALLLEYSLGLSLEAAVVEESVNRFLCSGAGTEDLQPVKKLRTSAVGDEISEWITARELSESL